MTSVERKMPNVVDVHRLIAEIKRRPALWDGRYVEYKGRANTPLLWQEIADILGVDVEQCKRKWKNLRDAYRAEVRRTQRRLERFKMTGEYDPKLNCTSKWVYFEPMSFISESKRSRCSLASSAPSVEGASSSQDNSLYEPAFQNFCSIKVEPHASTDEEVDAAEMEEDDEATDDILFEEFQSIATPQAARRLSSSISMSHAVADKAAAQPEVAETSANACKCLTKRADDQIHFLENLEREEQKLIQSTRQDISRSHTLSHIGDADYNFLVSFLPQMKKMSELQNLQFRAKMCEMVLNIMSPTPPANPANPATTTTILVQPVVSDAQYSLATSPSCLKKLQISTPDGQESSVKDEQSTTASSTLRPSGSSNDRLS